MFVFGYLRASTSEQDASRAKNVLKAFANQHGHRIAGWYIEGIIKAKAEGKYRGRVADAQKHELIRTLRLVNGKSLRETARLAGVSKMTVIRVCSSADK